MPEVGLPSVGELVQITYDGRTDSPRSCLAILDEYGWFVPVLSPGPYVEAVCVTSWCRVLVLPDDDETVSRVADGLVPLEYVARLLPDLRAALREAAIR